MLNQRVQRNSIKAAKKSQQAQVGARALERNPLRRGEKAKNRHSQRTHWNQSILDLGVGKIAGCQAP